MRFNRAPQRTALLPEDSLWPKKTGMFDKPYGYYLAATSRAQDGLGG